MHYIRQTIVDTFAPIVKKPRPRGSQLLEYLRALVARMCAFHLGQPRGSPWSRSGEISIGPTPCAGLSALDDCYCYYRGEQCERANG